MSYIIKGVLGGAALMGGLYLIQRYGVGYPKKIDLTCDTGDLCDPNKDASSLKTTYAKVDAQASPNIDDAKYGKDTENARFYLTCG